MSVLPGLRDEFDTRQRIVHATRVANNSITAGAGAGTTLFQQHALQLGTRGRHAALFPPSCKAKRSALSRGSGRRCGDPGTTRLSAAVARFRVVGFIGSRNFRVSAPWSLGLDFALARYWLTRTEAVVSIAAGFNL